MALREQIQSHPIVTVVITVVVLVVAGMVVFRSSGRGSRRPIEHRYFYDLSAGEVMVMKNQLAPVTTASGAQAVWAEVFSCGGCDDPSQRFVGFLEKASDELRQDMNKPVAEQNPDLFMSGMLVALPPEKPGDAPQWVPRSAPAAMRITESHMNRCPDRLEHCQP